MNGYHKNMRLKVAIVYTHLPHYRIPVFSELARSQQVEYHFYLGDSYKKSGIESGSMENATVNTLYSFQVFRVILQFGFMSRILRREYDAVIFLGNANVLSTWLYAGVCRVFNIKVGFWTHGWIRFEKGPKATIRNLFYRLGDFLLLYGDRAKQIGSLYGFANESLEVIYNSLNCQAQREIVSRLNIDAANPSYLISVGRLVGELDLILGLKALAYLKSKRMIETRLVVVGGGECRESLEKYAEVNGLDVEFLGAIYDEEKLGPLIMNSAALISPGKVGLAAMHALIYGVPVITHSDHQYQMPEFEILSGELSIGLFERDNEVDLADAIERCVQLADREKFKEIARDAIESNYTPERQCSRISNKLTSYFL